MNPKEILQSIIEKFNLEDFIKFFRLKSNKLRFPKTDLDGGDLNFEEGKKIAEGQLEDGKFIICSYKVKQNLTERSGKKNQYILGKTILKNDQADAGIFIFYDFSGNFRFSLIYANYFGNRRDWSNFKRFTYFVSKEFTNKTFLKQIGEADFSTIEKIKEVFSIEPVTKQFYKEIQSWYYWALDKIKFPDDYKYNEKLNNAINLIRLITRIIFIWFLKEKRLIPTDLFLKERLSKIVVEFMKDKKSSNFYNAILQNLFFATLNQKIHERKFADEKGYPANKKEYGIKNSYRYSDKFLISKDEVLNLFKDIPFLNGGLFDCLDKEDEAGKVIYIDGFSRNPTKQVVIPDYLFFQENEEKVNLSSYGLDKNKYVRGFFEILKSYNFTIDENTPIDQEIALDPELLGKIFENLLAEYNPETSTTARKATGSYYTPREIVDYMVETSLFEYLKIKHPEIEEEKIKILLSYSDNIPEFSEEQKKKIISSIDDIKILDPACGSGAFPMGVLHKLVFVLQKLDPENKYWYELQYTKALKETEEIFNQGDKNQRKEKLKEINEAFDENINYPDYARKLFLIENCIFGVDIQPIAIQISKLRFFISLVLDQKVDRSKENFGIRALPNLETKFVAANTLIGLEIPEQDLLFQNTEIKQIQEELAKERHKYFNAKTRSEKIKYQKQDKILRQKLSEMIKDHLFEEKQKEINQIKKLINEEELKLQKIIQEPENIEIVEQKNIFGEADQIKTDKKKDKIKNIKKQIKNLEKKLKIVQDKIEGDYIVRIARKIASYDLYDQNASVDWFDPEWMFGVKDGFDIVIGNPPYGVYNLENKLKQYYITASDSLSYKFNGRKNQFNLATLFIEKSVKILVEEGILSLIVPHSISRVSGYLYIREYLNKYTDLFHIVDEGEQFENVTLEMVTIFAKKTIKEKNQSILIFSRRNNKIYTISKKIYNEEKYYLLYADKIYYKIKEHCYKLLNGKRGFDFPELEYKPNKDNLIYLKGKNIGKYRIILLPNQCYINKKYIKDLILDKYEIVMTQFGSLPKGTIIDTTKMIPSGGNVIITFDKKKFDMKFILAILNSTLAEYYFYNYIINRARLTIHLDDEYVNKIRIPIVDANKQQPIISIVNKIFEITKDDDYFNNPEKQAKVKEYENQIDQMVYKLYDLSEEEIKIVEGGIWK